MSNYYLALGIDRDADLDKIKKAYRHYCKKYHPDLANKEQRKHFFRIQEAYETLSDENRRRDYDRTMSPPPGGGRVPVHFADSSVWEERDTEERYIRRFRSDIDDFFDEFVAGFFEEPFSRKKDLYAEIILSPMEAQTGGQLPIDVPVIEECTGCCGRGHANGFICNSCGGMGRTHSSRRFDLNIPPGIRSGASATVSLAGIGLKNVYLHIDISVR